MASVPEILLLSFPNQQNVAFSQIIKVLRTHFSGLSYTQNSQGHNSLCIIP